MDEAFFLGIDRFTTNRFNADKKQSPPVQRREWEQVDDPQVDTEHRRPHEIANETSLNDLVCRIVNADRTGKDIKRQLPCEQHHQIDDDQFRRFIRQIETIFDCTKERFFKRLDDADLTERLVFYLYFLWRNG